MDVAAWTLVLGAIAAAGAVGAVLLGLSEWRARRRSAKAMFFIDAIGETPDAGDGRPAQVYELSIRVLQPVTLIDRGFLYGARPHLTTENRLPPSMGPGDRVTLLLRSDDFDAAFVILMWREADGNGRAQWLPLNLQGPLGDELMKQREVPRAWHHPLKSLATRWHERSTGPLVGPGGVMTARLNNQPLKKGLGCLMPDDMINRI